MDLADAAGNASDGVHIASAAGVWQALVFGFGGVRDYGGELVVHAAPAAAPGGRWSSRCASATASCGSELDHDEERYLLDDGAPLRITVRGREHVVAGGRPLLVRPPGRSDDDAHRQGFSPSRSPHEVDLGRFDALLFDLDGVITRTATIHAAAWKRLFDDFLARRSGDSFDIDTRLPPPHRRQAALRRGAELPGVARHHPAVGNP